jgi:hypothetical protein
MNCEHDSNGDTVIDACILAGRNGLLRMVNITDGSVSGDGP